MWVIMGITILVNQDPQIQVFLEQVSNRAMKPAALIYSAYLAAQVVSIISDLILTTNLQNSLQKTIKVYHKGHKKLRFRKILEFFMLLTR